MPVRNSEIARIFYKIADLLEIEGANPFRVRAYRGAADNIERLPNSVAVMLKEGQPLTKIKGVGPDLSRKIEEIVKTGKLQQLEELETQMPAEMLELMKIGGLGPKRIQALHQSLGIKNIKELKTAAELGKVQDLPGFGEKIQQAILNDLNIGETAEQRVRIDKAEKTAESVLNHLRTIGMVDRLEVAGSFRRRKETVGDLDILAISQNGAEVIDHFAEHAGIREVVSQGETRSTVILSSGLHVDLRVVAIESYGAALLYFTGSKDHNVRLRTMALERGWKINEYGVFENDSGKKIAGESEEGIYALFEMDWIPPELRQGTGEFEAAGNHSLPNLITLQSIRGDLQAHTRASDGRGTLVTMAEKARKLGYEYLAITDHSRSLRVAGGLSIEELSRQIDEIDQLNERWNDFRLLKSSEVDILHDGSLDMPDDILGRLDFRVCSIHSGFKLNRQKQTERVLKAMDNPYFNILAHPTGRLIGKRIGYDIDLERIIAAANEKGCILEINAHPERLDLSGSQARLAKENHVKLAVSTDAHSISELEYMRFGIDQARRGWLENADVVNTLGWNDLRKLLNR